MDVVQRCQTPSERLRAILSVPKWQKQMAEIELGSHCYELPHTDAFQVGQPLLGFGETWLTGVDLDITESWLRLTSAPLRERKARVGRCEVQETSS